MRRGLTIGVTAAVTAVLTSVFWITAYNLAGEPDGRVATSGDVKVVDPGNGGPVAVADSVEVGPAGLAIPVAGLKASQLVDTFTQARAGGSRVHDAIDIMAPTGTPVIAAAPGTIEKIFFSDGGGGKTLYVRSEDGRWSYYYAHLNDYAPGLKEGQRVARGTRLGTVGFTGNANPAGPHLHFAINRMAPGEKWYDGTPVNPYPLLAGKKVSG
jgi:murein DD-endopeptidase MepM/ murein hydrolase activator NlpD